MTFALFRSTRLPAGLFGPLLALVALAMQLAAVSAVPFAGGAAAGVDRLFAASICHGDGGTADQGGVPAQHHAPDCAMCPLCQAIARAGVLLAAPLAAFVVPVLPVARLFAQPSSRELPGRVAAAANARGPPATL